MQVRWFDTPLGPMRAGYSDDGLHVLEFCGEPAAPAASGGMIARQVSEYFAGERRRFDIPLAPEGSDFQRVIWNALLRIPYGATTTYGELGRRLGYRNSARAVGRANATNPIAIIVPCHRVIGADGRLTGYAGGVQRKAALLALERRDLVSAMADQASFAS